MLDLATRSFSTELQNLLVDLLQEGNEEVRMSHESDQGKVLLAKETPSVLEMTDVSLSDIDPKNPLAINTKASGSDAYCRMIFYPIQNTRGTVAPTKNQKSLERNRPSQDLKSRGMKI